MTHSYNGGARVPFNAEHIENGLFVAPAFDCMSNPVRRIVSCQYKGWMWYGSERVTLDFTFEAEPLPEGTMMTNCKLYFARGASNYATDPARPYGHSEWIKLPDYRREADRVFVPSEELGDVPVRLREGLKRIEVLE